MNKFQIQKLFMVLVESMSNAAVLVHILGLGVRTMIIIFKRILESSIRRGGGGVSN